MRDLSREEKLEKRISEMAQEGRKNKWMRIRITFYVLSALVYFIALSGDIISGTAGLLSWLIFSPLIAIGVMCISYLVLAFIINGVIKDMFAIGEMEGRKSEIKFSKYER
jgi:fatty acid desaturase